MAFLMGLPEAREDDNGWFLLLADVYEDRNKFYQYIYKYKLKYYHRQRRNLKH